MKKVIWVIILALVVSSAKSQTKVEFDLSTSNFTQGKSTIPFDEPFGFMLKGVKKGDRYTIAFYNISKGNKLVIAASETSNSDGSLAIPIKTFLPPNNSYHIKISSEKLVPLSEEQKMRIKTADFFINFKARYEEFLFSEPISADRFTKISIKHLQDELINTINVASNKSFIYNELTQYDSADFASKSGRVNALVKTFQEKIGDYEDNVTNRIKKLKDEKEKNFFLTQVNNILNNGIQSNGKNSSAKEYKEKFFALVKLASSLPEADSLYIGTESAASQKKHTESVIKVMANEETKIKKSINEIASSLLNAIVDNTLVEINLIADTNVDVNTNAGAYTSQTFGAGYVSQLQKGTSYFSFNIFFRPVNNTVPLSNAKGGWSSILVRTSLNLGFTLEELATNKSLILESPIKSLIGNRGAIIGIGFRPLHFLKFDCNFLWYQSKSSVSSTAEFEHKLSPLIGISVNLNIAKIIAGQPNSLSLLQKKVKTE
jgi:hypothetical protein